MFTLQLGVLGNIRSPQTIVCSNCCFDTPSSDPPAPNRAIYNGTHLINGTAINPAIMSSPFIYVGGNVDAYVLPCVGAAYAPRLMYAPYNGSDANAPSKYALIALIVTIALYVI